MKTYPVGGMTFRTKQQIVEHVRAILDRTPIGATLERDDYTFMLDLLQRHRWAAQKIGSGAHAIRVDLNTHWKPRKMFTLIRVDGSETDFSYRAYIYPASAEADFREACRQAVVEDVLEFKRKAFDAHANAFNEICCAISGDLVAWNEAHVDHAPPWTFQAIVEAFVCDQGADVANAPLAGHEDNEFQHRFVDAGLAERFRNFHNERARLRVVTRSANLERRR